MEIARVRTEFTIREKQPLKQNNHCFLCYLQGRKEGRKEGRREGGREGRKEGREEGRKKKGKRKEKERKGSTNL